MQTLLQRLSNPLKIISEKEFELDPSHLPDELKERFEDASYTKPTRLSLKNPAPIGAEFLHRSHPIVEILSDYVVEHTLDYRNDNPIGGRCAVIETSEVDHAYSCS